MKTNYLQNTTLFLFSCFTIYWISINFFELSSEDGKTIFSGIYGLMALYGGIIGIRIAQKWGFFKSIIGQSLLLFSIGLIFQELGQLGYAYYINILKSEEVPYPSIGDVFYLVGTSIYIYGSVLLVKATGGKTSFGKSLLNKFIAYILPLLIVVISYYLFLNHYEYDWNEPLTIFFDIGYPFGQAVYVSIGLLAYILSRKLLGGYLRYPILLIIFALIFQYIADYQFTYQYSKDAWNPGELNEYIFFLGYFTMTMGLIQFNTVLGKLKEGTHTTKLTNDLEKSISNNDVNMQ